MKTTLSAALALLAATAVFPQNWRLNGNANPAANPFLGATTNNQQRLVILGANGRASIGANAPAYALHVTTATARAVLPLVKL